MDLKKYKYKKNSATATADCMRLYYSHSKAGTSQMLEPFIIDGTQQKQAQMVMNPGQDTVIEKWFALQPYDYGQY